MQKVTVCGGGTNWLTIDSRCSDHDLSRAGFVSWPFMSVHTWGEGPRGSWLLEIRNEGKYSGEWEVEVVICGFAFPLFCFPPFAVD